jgi:hypothetical protein
MLLLTICIIVHRKYRQGYGCLSYYCHLVLGLDKVHHLIHFVAE